MSLLDYALGDRAALYLLASCLLVTALVIIAAIIDIPIHALYEAGYARSTRKRHLIPGWILAVFGTAMIVAAFLGAAAQAYLAGSAEPSEGSSLLLLILTNTAFCAAVAVWGLTAPLSRHWGLCLGAFGLGLALLFFLLAVVLKLPFDSSGVVASGATRTIFAAVAGAIVIALGACLAAIVALVAYSTRRAVLLATEHSRRTDWFTSDWDANRKVGQRQVRRSRVQRAPIRTDAESRAGRSGRAQERRE